ncbi:PAS domain,RNA recognition motif domain [Cinara cedri]|uniref:PAS domain,RNA recognition motif domain n=1 Tax=Cinara cedri TaxID=506608 RepID=A0A5E4MD37_9HEMI|nr:PAS domain,RNA recognition motif domain [Cinara cedri]
MTFKRHECLHHHCLPTPSYGFSKSLSGFLMMMTQNGKLLYISDNAAEYLGHSMEDLLIHGDSVYDMIDKQDHQAVQTELSRSQTSAEDQGCKRMFLCRMNVSRNARRQMRFGDQKVVLVQGHYLSYLPLCSRNEPVFLATCSPVAMPETREAVVQGSTTVFTAIHSMDMKFIHVDKIGEFHLGFSRSELQGVSWYQLLHWECMREAQSKHRLITQSEQDRSCILLARVQKRATGDWLWIHCVLQVKDNMENSQQPVIVSTNQVLTDQEAAVMRANSWLYHYYMVQSKLQYGMQFEAQTSPRVPSAGPATTQTAAPQPPPPPPTVAIAAPVYAYHHQQSPHGGGHRLDAYPPTEHHQHHHQQQQQQHHHQQQQQQQQHQQQQQPVHFHHQLPDGYFRYAAATPASTATGTATVTAIGTTKRRHGREPEPVDYSIHSPEQTPPLKTEDGGHSMSADSPPSPPTGGDSGGGGGECATALHSSSLPSATSLGRSRALVKAAMDPGDLMMEAWNPSPPWSDCCSGTGALQKVPDVDMLGNGGNGGGGTGSYCGQPTPPTPGSGGSYHHPSSGTAAQPQHHAGSCGADEVPTADLLDHHQHQNHHHHHHHHHQPSTFTFDWPGEQYVPNVQHEVLVEPTPHYLVPFPPWPHAADHHRLFPLQPPPPGSLNRPSLIVRVDQDAAAAAADTSIQARQAIETMNFSQLNGKPIETTWSWRDTAIQKCQNPNLHVKGLKPEINAKCLYEAFIAFGNLISYRVNDWVY